MAVLYQNMQKRIIYTHKSTTNKSFLEMHYYLRDKGIQNNSFMLTLYDRDLAGIDPHDENLPLILKQKIMRECMTNVWYFFREVLRVPITGISTGSKFNLNRGNMAFLFCIALNFNIFLELPRQTGKTTAALCWYLYCYNFATANSEMTFLHKKMEESKKNLDDMKKIRDLLPPYLQLSKVFGVDGKEIRAKNAAETIVHPINKNKIRTVPSARSKVAAASLLRGRTTSQIYADEYAFILYNATMYSNMVPAFNTAARNARIHGRPYGILITTTPGFLTTEEGKEAFDLKEQSTPFNEFWYDKSYQDLYDMISENMNSNYVYIKYTYQQLGYDEKWFAELVQIMRSKWVDIRREVLLEWMEVSENAAISKEDIDQIATQIKNPIQTIMLRGKYPFNIYEKVDLRNAPIIGVDVSGGGNRDSSTITCIDSKTTKVFADFNCNYISTLEFANVIYELVTKYLPNAVVIIERNGGYGHTVLTKLMQSNIKKNLYWEIKDRVYEERFNGVSIQRMTRKTKVYGVDSDKNIRDMLIELMYERVDYHKDKIVSPILFNEMKTLEVSKTGKVGHSINSHDDSIFSWLWALYVYYHGIHLAENFGIRKREIFTDQNLEEEYIDNVTNNNKVLLNKAAFTNFNVDYGEDTENILNQFTKYKTFSEWRDEEDRKDKEAMERLISTERGKKAFAEKFNVNLDAVTDASPVRVGVPTSTFMNFNNYDDNDTDDSNLGYF